MPIITAESDTHTRVLALTPSPLKKYAQREKTSIPIEKPMNRLGQSCPSKYL